MADWANNRRRKELPRNWAKLREQVKHRANGQCEQLIDGERCSRVGNECHHKNDKHNHNIESLQWLCSECHAKITQQQANEAIAKQHEKLIHPNARNKKHFGLK